MKELNQLVTQFIIREGRYPTDVEIAEETLFREDIYPGERVDATGEEQRTIIQDATLEDKILSLIERALLLESTILFRKESNKKISKELEKALKKMERLLLTKGVPSNFIKTILEDFSSTTYVMSESDPYKIASGLSLGETSYSEIRSNKTVSWTGTLLYNSNNISQMNNENPYRISLLDNGTRPSIEIKVVLRNQRVDSLVIDTEDIKTTWDVWDLDNNYLGSHVNYNALLEIPVNKTVKGFKIVATRSSTSDQVNFLINNISVVTKEVMLQGEYLLGPYDVSERDFIRFTTCKTVPDGTSIRLFFSKDAMASYSEVKDEVSYALSNGTSTLTTEKINLSLNENVLDSENEIETDAFYLNKNIVDSEALVPGRLLLKRNTRQNNVTIGDAPSGWKLNDNGEYETNITYGQSVTLNLGTSHLYVNDIEITGTYSLAPNTYNVKVPAEFFENIREDIATETTLRRQDHLFPYNLRYVIEGYSYRNSYRGSRPYPEKQSIWATTMLYNPTGLSESPNNFSIVKNGSSNKIKIKTKYEEGWNQETYEVYYQGRNTNADDIYLKAILSTDSINKSPTLHFIEMEAI